MITVEKAMKDGKMRKAVENDNEDKKKKGKKLLIAAGIVIAAYFAYKMYKGSNNAVNSGTN
jgi:hypothetical protein